MNKPIQKIQYGCSPDFRWSLYDHIDLEKFSNVVKSDQNPASPNVIKNAKNIEALDRLTEMNVAFFLRISDKGVVWRRHDGGLETRIDTVSLHTTDEGMVLYTMSGGTFL